MLLRMLAFLILFYPALLNAIELSDEIYPSEDELLEALKLGEINLEQYVTLREIVQHGLRSRSADLLDEIPNLSYFLRIDSLALSNLEKEQAASFWDEPGRVKGVFRSRYLVELKNDQRTAYRQDIKLFPSEKLTLRLRLNREYSGRERVIERGTDYRSRTGIVRGIDIGSFHTRFGLGSIIGYRGKLLDSEDKIDAESFLFPDYGGMNGLLLETRIGNVSSKVLSSFVRDSLHSISTNALSLLMVSKRIETGGTLAVTKVDSRTSENSVTDLKLGPYLRYEYGQSCVESEMTFQSGSGQLITSGLIEGKHKAGNAHIRFAGWSYSDRFSDLTSGSKSAVISRKFSIEELSFDYKSRRRGQTGGLLRTFLPLGGDVRLSSSILYAQVNRDTARTELSAAVSKKMDRTEIELSFLDREKRRDASDATGLRFERRTRIEMRFRGALFYLRTYIAHQSARGRKDFLALFFRVEFISSTVGKLQFWSNLGRLERTGIDYWYMYAQMEQQLLKNLNLITKIAQSYRKNRTDSYQQTISLEISVTL